MPKGRKRKKEREFRAPQSRLLNFFCSEHRGHRGHLLASLFGSKLLVTVVVSRGIYSSSECNYLVMSKRKRKRVGDFDFDRARATQRFVKRIKKKIASTLNLYSLVRKIKVAGPAQANASHTLETPFTRIILGSVRASTCLEKKGHIKNHIS